ncbi:MAG TPA: hypothetical protein VI321_02075 [Burkholderiales bacterium]
MSKTLVYHLRFPDGHTESLQVVPPVAEPAAPPPWTELGFEQCSNCPLSPADSPRCPMALRFVPLVELFGKLHSYEDVEARVETDERTVTKRTTVQRVLRSLMGLLAASSDCPRITFLKPMAHFHLPFSSSEETIFRVVSTYLLAQYFREKQGAPVEAGLEGLKENYRQLQQVNLAMAKRMNAVRVEDCDGAINALVLLDLFAQALPDSIDGDLEELQPAFEKLLNVSST